MLRVLVIFVLVAFSNLSSADEYTFDNYEFEWKVLSVNDLDYSVMKTQERNFVQIKKRYSLMRLTAKEAVEISKVLSLTPEYFKKQSEASGETSNEVDAGDYKILFLTSPKYGFSIRIGDATSTRMTSVILSKEEAMKLQPELAKAESMVNFVKERINF